MKSIILGISVITGFREKSMVVHLRDPEENLIEFFTPLVAQ
jgi:hypothetical protein